MPAIEFDVWCGVCGSGICNETDVNRSTITVHCSVCADRISELENEVESREEDIADLEEKIDSLQCDIEDLKEDQE